MKQRRRLWRLTAVLLALSVIAAACGGDDDTSPAPAAPTDDSAGEALAATQAEAAAAEAEAAAAEAEAAAAEAEAEAARADAEAAQAALEQALADQGATEAEIEAAQQQADEAEAALGEAEAALGEAEAALGEAEAALEDAGAPDALPYGLTPGKPYAGTEVTFLICCEGAAQFQVWRASRPEFERLTGISVYFTDDPLGGLREKIVTESVANPGSWDVTILFDTWLPELSGFLAPIAADDLADIGIDDYPAATADLGVWGGTQYGVPARSHVMMFYYRADVLSDLGIAVPTTFDELLAAARTIHEADNGMSGFVLNWAKQSSISPIPWQQILKSGGAAVFDESGRAVFDSPEAIAATEVYQELLQYAPPGAAGYNEGDMRTSFANGEAAMTIAWSWSMEIFQRPDIASPEVIGNVGFTSEIPGVSDPAGPLAMAWPIAVSKDSPNAAAALEWLKWMTNPDLDLQAIAEKSINGQRTVVANRLSSLSSPRANAPEANDGFSQAMADAYTSATHQPIYPEFSEVTEIIETALSEIVAGADVSSTLRRAAAEANAVVGG